MARKVGKDRGRQWQFAAATDSGRIGEGICAAPGRRGAEAARLSQACKQLIAKEKSKRMSRLFPIDEKSFEICQPFE